MHKEELKHLLAALTPPNRLAMEISLATGLRISDVLALKADEIRRSTDGRVTVRELKTGKTRRVKLSKELHRRCVALAGRAYVFENRQDWKRPRTRQAVWKDLKRVARLFRVKGNIAPHTARKVYAVASYARSGDLAKVQKLLNHENEAVTTLYALADELTARRIGGRPLPLAPPRAGSK